MIRYSIIVPSLNEEKHIGKTLSDIAKYRPKDSEVILSDGGSTDKTIEIARKYVDKVIGGKDRSIAMGRNKGIRASNGEIIVFIDADVELPFNVFGEIEKALRDEKVDAGFFGIYPWDSKDIIKCGYRGYNILARVMRFLNLPMGATPCSFFRRAVLREIGNFSESVVLEDVEMFSKLSKKKKKYVMMKRNILLSARKFKKGLGAIMLLNYLKWWLDTALGKKIDNHHEVYTPVR